MPEYPNTLVIGDVHGHDDRLKALLLQEGIIDTGGRRQRSDVRVIQLGDLGHYGWGGDEDGDRTCWVYAKRWIDVVLWGNHDRAIIDAGHAFSGYSFRDRPTREVIDHMRAAGRLRLAAGIHGHLVTHAGLRDAYDAEVPENLETAVRWLNNADGLPVVNAISRARGGRHLYGGILWRDHEEDLSTRFPQVYGHTRGDDVRRDGESWCIDVGSADNGRLAALWLPELRVVEVGSPPVADAAVFAGDDQSSERPADTPARDAGDAESHGRRHSYGV